jgi:maleate isomerase
MMVPSSNTVVERELPALLPQDGSVTAHVSRVRVVEISASAASDGQFDLSRFLAAADLLADAQVDLILWNGTSASWLGYERDRILVESIGAHTGIPATTATIAINETLARLGARRIGLVTPYVAPIEAAIVGNYAKLGITVAASARRDLSTNTDFGAIEPAAIAAMVREMRAAPVDAIVILCTNLAGASVAPGLANELGMPVIDSVRAAVEHSLAVLGAS